LSSSPCFLIAARADTAHLGTLPTVVTFSTTSSRLADPLHNATNSSFDN
jgi:hypothetical protein